MDFGFGGGGRRGRSMFRVMKIEDLEEWEVEEDSDSKAINVWMRLCR